MGDDALSHTSEGASVGATVLGAVVASCAVLTAVAMLMPNKPRPEPDADATYEYRRVERNGDRADVIVARRRVRGGPWGPEAPEAPDAEAPVALETVTVFCPTTGAIEELSGYPEDPAWAYRAARACTESDVYQLAEMLRGAFDATPEPERAALMRALVECEFYRARYLPDRIAVSDTHGPWLMELVFLISSQFVPFERVDAEVNLHPEHAAAIREAYARSNSAALRAARGVARAALTVPTVPLLTVYVPMIMYALWSWGRIGGGPRSAEQPPQEALQAPEAPQAQEAPEAPQAQEAPEAPQAKQDAPQDAPHAAEAPQYADVLQPNRAAVLAAAERAGLVALVAARGDGADPTLVQHGASATLAFEVGDGGSEVVRVVAGSDATWGAGARTYGVVYAFDVSVCAGGARPLRVELFRPFGLLGARVLSVATR